MPVSGTRPCEVLLSGRSHLPADYDASKDTPSPMGPSRRAAIARLLPAVAAILASAALWWGAPVQTFAPWPAAVAAGLAALLAAGLSLPSPIGGLGVVPAVALAALFALGLHDALPALTVGLILAGAVAGVRRAPRPLLQAIGEAVLPAGRNGLALIATAVAVSLNGPWPLIPGPRIGLATTSIAILTYLLVYDGLLIADRVLRGDAPLPEPGRALAMLAALHLAPGVLTPLMIVIYRSAGWQAFAAGLGVLVAGQAVAGALARAWDAQQDRLQSLETLAATGQALRSNLELDPLLQATHREAAGLLGTDNLAVILRADRAGGPGWAPRLVSASGATLTAPQGQPVDDFAASVLEHGAPLIAPSAAATGRRLGLQPPPGVRSWLGVPLLGTNGLLGCMAVWLAEGEQPRRTFNERDLRLLRALAGHTEMAIENALLYAEARDFAAQLADLNEAGQRMNATLEIDRLQRLIVNALLAIARCDRAAVFLTGPDPGSPIRLLEAAGFSAEYLFGHSGDQLPLSASERSSLLDDGEAICAPDVLRPGAPASAAALELARREGVRSFVVVPLIARQGTIGALAAFYDRPHDYPPAEVALLRTCANQAALALANAQTYRQVDVQLARRVSQIVRMSDINQRLSATLDLNEVFEFILDAALDSCDAETGILVLGGPADVEREHDAPRIAAARGVEASSGQPVPPAIDEMLAESGIFTNARPFLDNQMGPAGRCRLGVPILLDGEVIGVLALQSMQRHSFTQDDVGFVSQLAVQAAAAIRNAQLYRRAQSTRDRLRAILDASQDGLMLLDERGDIVMTNSRMSDFWHLAGPSSAPEAASALDALGHGLGYEPGRLGDLLEAALDDPTIATQTDLYATRPAHGQRQRFVERRATPVCDEAGAFIGLLLMFRDVTEQRELEAAREDLTRMIVHELRAPLQAVMGSIRLIEKAFPEGDPIVDQATEAGERAIKKLLNLVNNLLDLSRMEQGDFVLEPAPARIEDILEDALEELLPLAHESGTAVRIDPAPGLPPVLVDRDMIARVVFNLLDNALKYSGPSATIELAAIRCSADGDDEVCVAVRDDGPGIPDEFKETIFDRFAQIPGRRAARRSTGLGLAFSRMAIESHGGQLWVEDNPGGGSVFRFTLPAAGANGPAAGRGQ